MKLRMLHSKLSLNDCQGNAIHNKGKVRLTMMVYTHNGSCIALKETFVLAYVRQLPIALGRWLKKGRDLQKTKEISSGHLFRRRELQDPSSLAW